MKLSYPVTTPDCTIPMMAFGGDFERNLEYIKSCGYEGVELLIRDLDQLEPETIAKRVKDAGLEVAAVATSPSPSQDKVFMAGTDEKIHEEAIKRGKDLIAFGGSLHVPMVIGRFRGNVPEQDEENARKKLEEDLLAIGEYGEKYGGKIALEIQNRTNVNTFNTVAEGVEWIEKNKITSIGLLLDTFHMELTETSIPASFIKAKDHIDFIHLSDSFRLVPGTGHISFKDVLAVLDEIGYQGFLSMEIKQIPDSRTAAKLSWEYLDYMKKEILKK